MCGRFTLITPTAELAEQFTLPEAPTLPPRYNIAPGQPVATVRQAPSGSGRELVMMQWGLVPSWARDLKIGSRMINARSETAAEKPAFRSAFRRRRCLVLADGFYEWQHREHGKQPFYIRLQDGRPFGLAGLWEYWEGAEGALESCTILTTTPNDLMRPLHDRMPVILSPEHHDLWLDAAVQQTERLQPLLAPYSSQNMTAYPIGAWVNKPANEGPRCIEPLAQPGQIGLEF
ncbi:MAG: SOS response-associated peptidase [Chloroflexota bacterium]